MIEARADAVLNALAADAPGGVLLWRGADLGGTDVDLVVLEGRDHEVVRSLRDAGLTPAPQADGRLVWRSLDADAVVIDTLPARGWHASYPPLRDVVDRAGAGPAGVLLASAPDRLLVLAAEAVAGNPLDKIARKAQALLAEPGAAAAAEYDAPLARLIADPEALRASARRGRLPYPAALRVALRSPRARAALRKRVAGRIGIAPRVPVPEGRAGERGALVALSGMDGSGKSSAALELVARLEGRGHPAVISWNRFAAESALLGLIATPVRRMLGRNGPIADPVATGDSPAPVDDRPDRRGPVAWTWVVVVAAVNARSCRRAAALRRRGLVVVCDRWVADALVDLEVRYGRHRVAEWVLRRGVPQPDIAALLQIDAATSARRKPGDQAESVLAAMAERYATVAGELGSGFVVVDATRSREHVAEEVGAAVAAALRSPGGA